MSIVPQDFLAEGLRIREASASEISLRSAASRYYYGLYHFAKAFADQNGAGIDNYYGGTHAKLSDYFDSGSLPEGVKRLQFRKVAILLRQCHAERCRVDYQLGDGYKAEHLDGHVLSCDACIQAIEAMIEKEESAESGAQ